jgi:hypothetical protein
MTLGMNGHNGFFHFLPMSFLRFSGFRHLDEREAGIALQQTFRVRLFSLEILGRIADVVSVHRRSLCWT